jgi:dUTP pyrophosphatase
MTIKVSRTSTSAITPTRKHEDDAGIDLYYSGEDFNLRPFKILILPTDVRVKIPDGCVGIVEDKSRNNFLIIGRVDDPNYRGSILVKVANITDEPIGFKHGQAIAQLVIYKCVIEPIEEVDNDKLFENEDTSRGNTGGIVSQADILGINFDAAQEP